MDVDPCVGTRVGRAHEDRLVGLADDVVVDLPVGQAHRVDGLITLGKQAVRAAFDEIVCDLGPIDVVGDEPRGGVLTRIVVADAGEDVATNE